MANDLEQLKQLAEQVYDPNGGPSSILAQEDQDFNKELIKNLGRYQGLFYEATLFGTSNDGVIGSGIFSWNNNAMNQAGPYFIIKLSELSKDGNKTIVFINTLKPGDIIRIKDEKGRSCYYKYLKHIESTDTASNPVIDVLLSSFNDNIGYTYQTDELRDISVEFYPMPITQGLNNVQNIIQQMKLDFKWSLADFDNEAPNTRWYYSSRIGGKVSLLGVKFQNYDILTNFANENPGAIFTLLIDRYSKHSWKGNQNNPSYLFINRRVSGFKHTKATDLGNKINEIPLTGEEMLLNFNQDFYFRQYNGNFGSITEFPIGMGCSKRGIHLTSITALGFIDLAFRIRIEIPSENYTWESQHIGKIRMIGIDDRSQSPIGIRKITYSYK